MSCTRCGQCCLHVALYYTKEDLKAGLQEWADARGIVFQELDDTLVGALIPHRCPNLKDDKDGKYICTVWGTDKLPSICLERPNVYALKLFPKCGHNVKIIETLNKVVDEKDDKEDAIRMKKEIEKGKFPGAKVINEDSDTR